ncbi:MAG: DeoR/GlpR family DNA-binding transcription regulator, partial [Acidimicrobiales bacterium]
LLLRRLFVSAAALDPDLGSSEASLAEAEIKLALAAAASEVILAVDSSKLGHRSPARCLELSNVSILVTELEPDDAGLDPYRDLVRLV